MIAIDDLVRLAASGPERIARIAELAQRLAALEAERGDIVAELADFGISEPPPPQPMPAQPAPAIAALPPAGPLCEVCGAPATETVDGTQYCATHGAEAVALAAARKAMAAA